MSRKLVTIRQVSAVNPIEGADAIECLTIEGWKVVSQKGNFQPGDLAVYFEIDSFLPDCDERWQDLVDKSGREFDGKRGHRLRTIKLRGQVSQGFSIPLRKFPEILSTLAVTNAEEAKTISDLRDMDFSPLLGVVKWDPPIPAELQGLVKGLFPSFIRKTDQERVQNIPGIFDDHSNDEFEESMKLDGSSMTVYIKEGEPGVCSRNLELKISEDNKDNTLVKTALMSGLLTAMATLGTNYAVQGELMGPGIQGNREQLKEHQFYVFDIFDIDTQEYLPPDERVRIFAALKTLGADDRIKHVPVLNPSFKLTSLGEATIDALLKHVDGPSIKHVFREGNVYKRKDGKFSFKVINNRFLLKERD